MIGYTYRVCVCLLLCTMCACNPIGTGSFLHSLSTGNSIGIASGFGSIAVEENTGKSVMEHVVDEFNTPVAPAPAEKPHIQWSYELLSNAMNQH